MPMKIAVLLKYVPDTASVLRINEHKKSYLIDNAKYILNPYDEYALEEAVKLKEKVCGEVIVVSMGDENTKKLLRSALAVGADRAVHVERPLIDNLTSKGVSKILAAVIETIKPDIIFAGKQAVDDDSSQVPERVAEIVGISHSSAVIRFHFKGTTVEIDRVTEDGHYTMELSLPALFTIEKGINTPRYPTLPNIMKAKRKEITEMTIPDLGLSNEELQSGVTIETLSLPRKKRLTKILHGDTKTQVTELVSILREEKIGLF
jgi:electron transfer flavoprotein beta subunit